jgi:hypothetical protein
MKRMMFWIGIINLLILNSCTSVAKPQSPCNEQLLESFSSIEVYSESTVRELNEVIFDLAVTTQAQSIDNFQWDISKREDSGCIVTLSATINGVNTIGPRYFIKLPEYVAYPDNEYAKDIIFASYSMAPELNWTNGIQINYQP